MNKFKKLTLVMTMLILSICSSVVAAEDYSKKNEFQNSYKHKEVKESCMFKNEGDNHAERTKDCKEKEYQRKMKKKESWKEKHKREESW
jgi:hypothetical protein